jgi:hypothetical protein
LQLNCHFIFSFFLILILAYIPVSIANISGVMGPNIESGDRSIQFRSAISLAESDSQQDNLIYRVHYQHAFNDTFRTRVVMQYQDIDGFEYDFFRTELMYNFKKLGAGEKWSSALRFDLRTYRGSEPEEFAINWANQWDLSNEYRLRTTLILGQEIGGNRQLNSFTVQTRASLSRQLESGVRVGLQMMNEHGEMGGFVTGDERGVYIGPVVIGHIGQFKYELRYLNGVTDAVRAHNVFFRVTTQL